MTLPAMAALLQAASTQTSDTPQSAEQIIEAYITALGGKQALAQITSRKAEGRVEIANRKEAGQKFTTYWREPDLSRMSVVSDDEHIDAVFDGTAGWRSESDGDTERLGTRSLEVLLRDANPLRYARLAELYPAVALDGDPPQDAPRGAALVYRGPKETLRFYFDTQSHLLTEIVTESDSSETGPRHYRFEDYRALDGVLFPFAIREIMALPNVDPRAARIEHVLRYNKVQQNINIAPTVFSLRR
jgi:hypothetical protein